MLRTNKFLACLGLVVIALWLGGCEPADDSGQPTPPVQDSVDPHAGHNHGEGEHGEDAHGGEDLDADEHAGHDDDGKDHDTDEHVGHDDDGEDHTGHDYGDSDGDSAKPSE